MTIVPNPNNWSCLAACAATIAGATLEDFCRHVGHDGSEAPVESGHPEGRRSFTLAEAESFLRARGWRLRKVGHGWEAGRQVWGLDLALVALLPRSHAFPHWTLWHGPTGAFLETGPKKVRGARQFPAGPSANIGEVWEVSRGLL